ncbi:hypothetical protein CH276_27970 [Rhodococcus sp. 06-470-2]|uniref:hypothetical protein n=1 Tax=unclassified Rhodococcus (in: high G+C Gram-positive bacteria) TaxID=192944 RepID=UPI000B9A54BC|nr:MULTISPECIES: hypothetical protein [unclassified Rhodococcus (in: high G+C Gram-positive bacteria)]OZC55946.1 hypothetical protein CH276_27970 [Rhodococcus sp. 06-470-2]OZE64826.1 hypothetical protein CH265_10290 [Rhodococcus sp. 05-2221-1B]
MSTRALPASSRNAAGGRLPTISRRRSVVPAMSHRLLTASDLPPLPQLSVLVAADLVAVVQLTVAVRVTARVSPGFGGELTASAAVRADGGRKFVDAEQALEVSAIAAVVARYTRSASVVANVAAIAVVAVSARPQFGGTITASAIVTAVRTALPATQSVSVIPSAQIVAYGGQVAVGANTSLEVTAAASAIGRLPASFTATAEVTATAERVIRMTATAAQAAAVNASAAVAVPVVASQSMAVAASATVAPQFAGLAMDKSGNQTLPASTWTQITGWTARSGSAVVSNGLLLPAGVSATAVVQVTYGGSNAVNTCRVLADGVVAGTAPAGGQTPTATITIPAAATDRLITVEGYVNGLTGGRAVAASGTFLTLA